MGDRRPILRQMTPWRRDAPWALAAIEGTIVLAIGVYILADADGAKDIARQLIAGVLLVISALQILGGFRDPTAAATPIRLVRGGSGATVGLIVLLEPISDYLNVEAARWILAWGFLVYGFLGLADALIEANGKRAPARPLLIASLSVVMAMLLFTGNASGTPRISLLGAIVTIAGLLLLGIAIYRYRASPNDQPTAPVALAERSAEDRDQ